MPAARSRHVPRRIWSAAAVAALVASSSFALAGPVAAGTGSSAATIGAGRSGLIKVPGAPAGEVIARIAVTTRGAARPTKVHICSGSATPARCATGSKVMTASRAASTRVFRVHLYPSSHRAVRITSSKAAVRVRVSRATFVRVVRNPGPGTVGVPRGMRLTKHAGDLTITKPGAVVNGLDIAGVVRVKARGVTIKNSIIRGGRQTGNTGLITNDLGAYRFMLKDSTLVANHPSPYVNGIIGSNFTVLRSEIAKVVDSVHVVGSNVLIRDSWLHSNLYFARDPNHGGGPSHADNVQIQSGRHIRLVHNRIEGATSAVVQTTQDRGAISDLVIKRNRIGGGACQINIAIGSRAPIKGIVVKRNLFRKDSRVTRCAIIAPPSVSLANVGNRYVDGSVVTVSKGR
jgi:hypothetical protein